MLYRNEKRFLGFAFALSAVAFACGWYSKRWQNNPLPGASVVIKGTTTGATTDFDGAFSIDAKQGDVLVISFVGFETQEVTYDGSELAVSMQEGLSSTKYW